MGFLVVVVASVLAAHTVAGDGRYQAIASSAGTVYYSADFGQAWVESGQVIGTVKALAFAQGADTQVALTTTHQVMVSQNFGHTWTEVQALPEAAWTNVAINNDDVIVAVGRAGLFYSYGSGSGRATDYSIDGAQDVWFVDAVAASNSPVIDNVALNINCSLYQYFRSSWTQINTPFAGQTALSMFGLSVSQNVVSSNNFYTYTIIATTSGVHFSNDGARSWITLFNNISGIPINGTAMSVDGQYQAVVYESNYLFVSTNFGQTWTNIYATLPQCFGLFSSIAMSPSGNGIIIGALNCQSQNYCGISTTLPYGKVWQQLCSPNIQSPAVVAIA